MTAFGAFIARLARGNHVSSVFLHSEGATHGLAIHFGQTTMLLSVPERPNREAPFARLDRAEIRALRDLCNSMLDEDANEPEAMMA